jgi:hypothetical protein
MKKQKKEKVPLTKEQMIANDPLWEKVFKLRLNGQNKEADDLKKEILDSYN